MKIIKDRPTVVDIGSLDHTLRLPVAPRAKAGMRTICDACRKSITNEYFIGGFKSGHQNMKFHEACVERLEEGWDGCDT